MLRLPPEVVGVKDEAEAIDMRQDCLNVLITKAREVRTLRGLREESRTYYVLPNGEAAKPQYPLTIGRWRDCTGIDLSHVPSHAVDKKTAYQKVLA